MKNKEIAPLVKRVKEGDTAAFDELYNSMWQTVYYMTLKQVGSHEDATDLTQEILFKVSKEIHTLKSNMAFNMWINTITVNHCNRYLSNRRKDVAIVDEVDDSVLENKKEFLPEEMLFDRELCKAVSAMVSELPSEQRQAVLLYYYNDLTAKEIAKLLDTTPNAVNIKLSRARTAIKAKVDALQREGISMYGVAAVPVLTRILILDAECVCTPEICEQIRAGLQASLTASVGTAGTGTTVAAATTALITKIGIGVLTVSILSGGAVIGMNIANRQAQSPVTPPAMITEVEPKTETIIENLEDFVGIEDAALIRSWGALSNVNQNPAFLEIKDRHGFTMVGFYIDDESMERGMYVLYALEKQDKRLLLCEFYQAESGEWAVAHAVEDKLELTAQDQDIKVWFENHLIAV